MFVRALLALLSIFDDLLSLSGGICIVIGVSMIYAPAAWIVAGLLLIVAGVLVARETSAAETGAENNHDLA